MSPKTLTLLSEKNIYVSWGILALVAMGTFMIARIMFQQDQYLNQIQNLDKRVSRIETDLYFNKAESIK